jgi:hypothetical protein
MQFFKILRNTEISIFVGNSKICLWADFGSFGQIWAEFVTLTVVESMLEARVKSQNLSNSSTMNPNITWSGSSEHYHPYLTIQKVSKNPQTYYVYNTLPKSAQSHFGCLRPLGIKNV